MSLLSTPLRVASAEDPGVAFGHVLQEAKLLLFSDYVQALWAPTQRFLLLVFVLLVRAQSLESGG